MTKKLVIFAALLACAIGLSQPLHAAEEFNGSWNLMPSKEPGKVRFGLMHQRDGGNSHHESDWTVAAFEGLDFTTHGKHDVSFTIPRAAGRITGKGFLDEGEGAGVFHFAPDAKFIPAMEALGFTGIDEEKQFAMAMFDVTPEFAETLKGEKLTGLDTDKLLAFRIFNVTPLFIRELRDEGLAATSSDKVIAFRIHEVTPAMARDVRKAGLEASEDQLVAMRIHGVTPEFIAEMKSRGLKDLTIDQLVGLRIHGID